MDPNKIVEALKATLNPDQRVEAERYLDEIHKIIGFVPTMLQIVMSAEMEMPVRQAGVIYLKNVICEWWKVREPDNAGDAVPFSIHEQDKVVVRTHLVEAIIQAPDPVRVQLLVCLSQLVKEDYPGKWPELGEKIFGYLQDNQPETIRGALFCLHQLVKNFEYKKKEDREVLDALMQHMLPMIYERCNQLLPDQSEAAVFIQKQILKIFYALIQFTLPLNLLSKEVFTSWIEMMKKLLDRPVPEAVNQLDAEERDETLWWKCKKWAVHVLERSFERYGSPGNVTKEYTDFAEWYLKTFSAGVVETLLSILDQYQRKVHVSQRVLQLTLRYLDLSVTHAHSWKFVKPHMQGIIQHIIFPLMCHREEDEELWQSDPVEYIRLKYDVFEEFLSPVLAAQGLLHTAVAKRKEVLSKTMGFVVQLLSSEITPQMKDGALHIIGSVADVLLQKAMYKDQVELMLANHVFNEFQSQAGFLRARACWMLQQFSEVPFKNMNNLQRLVELLAQCLCEDKELPVRVEASMAIQHILSDQEKARDLLAPRMRDIILHLLTLIRETENDDLTTVLQKFVCTYVEEVIPLAVEISSHLAETFANLLTSESSDGSDDKAIAAMGILNTLDTIVGVLEEHKEIIQQVEGIVLNVVGLIIQQASVEFFEEMFSLLATLNSEYVSERMWQVFPTLIEVFNNDNIDYFTDMMPCLHNYITVDPQTFISNPKHLEIVYEMCNKVLHEDVGEDAECHAAKLLEVIILQFKGQIDGVVDMLVVPALERLMREIQTSELRAMCLQVVIAGLYYNPPQMLDRLEKSVLPHTNEPIMPQFLRQWLSDVDCFLGLHDRRMCVLGLCCLLSTPAAGRPAPVTEAVQQYLPALIVLFKGLQRAYAQKAAAEQEDEENGEGGEEAYEEDELDDDEDALDDDAGIMANGDDDEDDDDDDDDDDDEMDETALESYGTVLDKDDCDVDEYQIFQNVLVAIQASDPAWYEMLTSHLNEEQRKDLGDIMVLSDKKRADAESKKIKEKGGYAFTSHNVPQSFNFASP